MFHTRRTFLQASAIATAAFTRVPHPCLASLARQGGDFDFPGPAAPPKPAFPVTDYHVHLSNTLTIDQALELGKKRGVNVGIVEHPGEGFPIKTDADLQNYIDRLRKYPVHIGLQPVYAGWSKAFSKPVIAQLDYVLMDALTLPNPDGTWLAIWQIDTMVDDAEAFMTRYLQFIEQVMTTEPIDIFAWPTFLPVPIARQYAQLWTPKHVDHIIDMAKSRKLAIEINEVAHVPDEYIHHASEASRLEVHVRYRQPQPKRHAFLLLLPDGAEVRTY